MRRFFNDAHVADTRQCHIEGTGNGGCGKGQHVYIVAERFQFFLLCDTETLLFVDDDQAEVFEFDVLAAVSYTHLDVYKRQEESPVS